MNFQDKEKTYQEIEWIQQNSSIGGREKGKTYNSEVKKRLFRIFGILLEHDGYKLSNGQARFSQNFGDDEIVMFMPFDFTAINKTNPDDWLGVVYMHNAKTIDVRSVKPYLHNAKIQNRPRQIIVTNSIIDNDIRGQLLNTYQRKLN